MQLPGQLKINVINPLKIYNMAKIQENRNAWYTNLNKARGYTGTTSKWPLIAAAVAFVIAVILILKLSV